MAKLRVGLIGCGGRGRAHARGYAAAPDVELAACADLYPETAQKAAAEFKIPKTYTDYKEMLERERLDVVSIALWTGLHHEAVLACVNASKPPKLINAEKPMAPTLGAARSMHEACAKAGIALTFCHQRRLGSTFAKAREFAQSGAIGSLRRMEGYCPNLFDWGTHWFDMLFYYNAQTPVAWVMGQIDVAADKKVFGTPVETSGLSLFRFVNGVEGLLVTGSEAGAEPTGTRIYGSAGIVEAREHSLRILREGRSWEDVDCGDLKAEAANPTTRYVRETLGSLRESQESLFSSRQSLMATELIFATYESARRRAKVTLPLGTDDSALLTMLEKGEIVAPKAPV
ncbi:MAG: hypothetical protein AMXMBFR7_00280 [Planctomycetota bacterium]